MAHSTTTLTISLIMIMLFSIAIIGFSIGFANDNSAYISISDDEDISGFYFNSKENVSTFNTESESTYSTIINTSIEPGSDVLKTPGSFSITWGNVFSSIKNTIKIPYKAILGGDGGGFGVFLYTFLGILGFLAALFIIKTWRGNPWYF